MFFLYFHEALNTPGIYPRLDGHRTGSIKSQTWCITCINIIIHAVKAQCTPKFSNRRTRTSCSRTYPIIPPGAPVPEECRTLAAFAVEPPPANKRAVPVDEGCGVAGISNRGVDISIVLA